MAGRVDDIDLDVVVEHCRVLSQNRDAALALQFVGVHHPLDQRLIGAERAALA